ncbi:MAG: cytochrome C [Methylococcales bacterium]
MQIALRLNQLSLLLVLCLAVQLDVFAGVNVFDKPVLHPAIPLVDEAGQHVLISGKPYSTRMSCGNGEGGGCHDIDKISKAYHFEMGREEAGDAFGKKRHLAPLVSPGYFGGFNCGYNPGQTNNPEWLSKKTNSSEAEFLDYGAPGLIKNCGQCHNGGGFAEKDRDGNRYDQTADADIKALDGDYYDWLSAPGSNQPGAVLAKWDWKKSGVVEPDCLICHADFSKFKAPVAQFTDLRTKQFLANGFFKYTNSAIFAFLNVAPDSVDGKTLLKADASLGADGLPKLQWNADAFDSSGKIVMPMLRFPADDNCMQCHVTSHERRGFYGYGEVAVVEKNADGTIITDPKDDVHKGVSWSEKGRSRVTENCNACHSKQYYKDLYLNVDLDADHNFLIGNSDEDVRRDLNFQPGPLSCEHCHNGPAFGGAENPALPSGHANILDAHRELWKANGDMVGYPANTLNKVTQVHLDIIACQACHITKLTYQDKDLPIRYRYRKSEDGRLKMMPYKPSSRYYWIDKTNQRVLTRKERLAVGKGVDSDPQTYQEIKDLKAGYDKLLSDKGYAKADTQMVWTESNEYLLSHNTRPAVMAMPCEDCHARKQNGSISSLVEPDRVLGKKNSRVVSQIADSSAYAKLVAEGVVKLDMPYFEVSGDGKIVENVDDILYETKLDPFTTVLRTNAQDIISGEFRVVTKGDALAAAAFAADASAFTELSNKLAPSVYLFNNANAGATIKQLSVMVNFNNASKLIVPNYRVEVAANNWTSFTLSPPSKKPKKKTTLVSKGTVTSPVYSFQLQDQQKQSAESLAGNKFMIKLPYAGRSKDYRKVDLFETRILSGDLLAPLKVLAADILAVKPGNTVTPGYVVAVVDRLPEQVLLVDLKKAKKKK